MRIFYATFVAILLASCTSSAPSIPGDCAVLPRVVAVSPRTLRIRSGLSTVTTTHRRSEWRGLFEQLQAMRKSGELRTSCSGVSDVLVASEETDPIMVVAAAAGLKRGCETPTRLVLGDAEPPVPISGVHFCGCQARLPLSLCSSAWVDVWPDRVQVERVASLIGDACSPGAYVMAGPGTVRPESPERITRDYAGPSRVAAAIESLGAQHGDLPPCGDAYLRFHDAHRWGEVRAFLQAFHEARPDRITMDIVRAESSDAGGPER